VKRFKVKGVLLQLLTFALARTFDVEPRTYVYA